MRTYLVGWPNGTWSVLGFSSKPSDDELTFSIDAIGDPSIASVFRVKRDGCGDFAFDFPRTPKDESAKPELPACAYGDLVPVRLYGDLKAAWEKHEEAMREFS